MAMAKKSWLAGLLLVCLSAAGHAQPELKGNPEELRRFLHPSGNIVTIRGEAERKAYSDEAIVTLTVTTENKLLSDAISKNSTLRSTLSDELVQNGVAKEAIRSSKFSSSPQYGWFGEKPSSYEVINRTSITISNEAHLETIAAIADKFSEVELTDTTFEHTKKDEYQTELKAEALDKILKQKQFYESVLSVELTPIGIRDSHVFQNATPGAMALEQTVSSALKRLDDSQSLSPKKQRGGAKGASFDEVQYQVELAVDFKIEAQRQAD